MKRKSLLIMLLVALFVPLAMNAQTKSLKKSAKGLPKLEVNAPAKAMPSNLMLTKLESAKETALEELNGRGVRADNELLTEGFENMSSISTNYSATGWYAYNAGSGNNWTLNSSSSYAYGGSKSAQYQYNSSNPANCYLVSAPFTVSSNMSELTVGLYERVRGESFPETFEVFFVKASDVSNLAGVASATKYNAIASASYTNTTYAQQSGTVTNSALAGQSVRVVVHCTSAADKWYLYIDDITVTEKIAVEGCSAPTNFAATNVTTNSVTLSWTETGTSDTWVIYYMAEDDETTSYEIAETNPFTLTGLNPVTNYYALVTPYCGDLDQDSDVIEFTTQDLPCAKPTNLSVTAMTPSSATVSWSGEADSYTIQYRVPSGFRYDFESAEAWAVDNFAPCTTYDGDQTQCYGLQNVEATNFPFTGACIAFQNGISDNLAAHGGNAFGMMASPASSTVAANDWFILPEITINNGDVFSFWAREITTSYGAEVINVGVYGTSQGTFSSYLARNVQVASTNWEQYSYDLSAYAGQTIRLAINYVSLDIFGFMFDDIFVGNPNDSWDVTLTDVTSPYTITGLQAETTYEWQVQGDCGADGESLWSAIGTFTTPTSCDAPSGLTATNITGTSATLNWAEVLDEYNVTYTKGFVYDFESAEPWAVDNFAPCTTYDGDQTQCYGFEDADVTNIPFTGACVAFQNGVSSNLAAHSGNAFGMMISPASSTVSANDWFILPEIAVESGDVFSFWAREITTNYGAEVINVGVYGSQGSFTSYLGQNVQITSTEWTEYSYDLSAYAGQTIQLAINYVSLDIFGFMFDDIFVGNPNWSNPVSVTGSTYTLEGLSMNTNYVWQVQGVDCDGNGSTTDWSSASFTTLNGILVESISADDVEVVVGGTASIANLEVLPADATNPAVTYTSNDETIATVTDAGVVTGVAPGTTTITIAATDGSNVRTTINVTVNGIDVTGITAEDVEVITGETATISYTVDPTNATDQSVTFTSANTNIATVDANGVVTGVSAGETTITIASVSNPDITAEITVTVTSNPNAVQFTVNAPATAHPGDVITVDFMLAAPTAGTYTGFTGLDVSLYFETAAFQYNSKANGAVADAVSAIDMSQVSISGPSTNYPNRVKALLATPANTPVTAEGTVFSVTFTVLQDVALGSYTFDVAIAEFDYTIDISNVVDIPYEFTPSTVNVSNSYTKHIIGWASEEEGSNGYNYYLIASPLATNVAPTAVTNMIADIANEYDLYYFDQEGDEDGNEWMNYKSESFNLEPGKGYLYANKNSVDLIFTGAASTENEIKVTLDVKDCSNASGHFEGWNLVGNPFGVTAYIDRDCYKMNAAGNEIIAGSGNSVEAMEGIFVIATTDGEEMTFSKTNSGNRSKVVLNVSDSQGLADRAIVRFGEGSQLPKFQLFGNSTKVYFPEDDQDYAVVRSANENELPVNFKASSNGSYTMSVNVEELDMDYLHLIDNMTGMDVDLLQTPSYTFEATTSDEESRFRLVFATVDGVNEHSFGFVNASGNLCIFGIEGKATVQVIDVLGHVLSSETFSGSYEKHLDVVPGVYMIRLIQGNDVRVQKMVVR